MAEAAAVMVPLLLFMLIPLGIPVVAILGGALADRVADRRESRVSDAGT